LSFIIKEIGTKTCSGVGSVARNDRSVDLVSFGYRGKKLMGMSKLRTFGVGARTDLQKLLVIVGCLTGVLSHFSSTPGSIQ